MVLLMKTKAVNCIKQGFVWLMKSNQDSYLVFNVLMILTLAQYNLICFSWSSNSILFCKTHSNDTRSIF